MKILIILALVACVAANWQPKTREQLQQIRSECMKAVKLPQDLKEKINNLEYPDNDVVKEFILCDARDSGMWGDTIGWFPDRLLKVLEGDSTLSKEEIANIIKGCLDDNSQKSSLKDWAFREYKCLTGSKLSGDFVKKRQTVD